MQYNKRQARKAGFLARPRSGRTFLQSLRHYLIEFDSEYGRREVKPSANLSQFLVCSSFLPG
jgi:hypothetical protein